MAPILHNLLWLLAGKGVGAVLSLVYLGLAARTLGAAPFGQFTLVLGTAQAVAALVGFQCWQVVVRFGAGAPGGGLAALVGFCTALDLAAGLAGCGLAAAAVALLGPLLGWSARLSHEALGFCVATLLSVRSTPVGVLRLLDRFELGALADATTPLARFAGALAAVGCGGGIHGFLLAWAAAEVLTAAAYWIAARAVAGPALRLPRPRDLRAAPARHPGLWRFTWTTNLVLTLDAGSRQLAVPLVGLCTGPVVAGNYRLAMQLSQAIVRVSDMAARAIFAEAAKHGVAAGRGADPRALLAQVTRLTLAAGGGLALLLLLGRQGLLLLGGRSHQDALPLLRLLAVAAAIDLAGIGFEPVLLALGQAGRALRLRAIAALALLASLAVLLPAWGGIGAAWATLLSSTVGILLFGRAAWRAASRLHPEPVP